MKNSILKNTNLKKLSKINMMFIIHHNDIEKITIIYNYYYLVT